MQQDTPVDPMLPTSEDDSIGTANWSSTEIGMWPERLDPD